MKDSRHIIWTDYLDYDDWKEDLEAQYPELSANERMNLMYEINGTYFQDEKTNLDIQLSRPILVVGDLGLWHGRRMGYKEIESGVFADHGYVRSNGGRFVDIYDGKVENIPEEYRIKSPKLYERAVVGRTEKDMER